VIEKHIPSIVADFYANLLRYPPTRKHFLSPDGSLNEDYLQKRRLHLTNFWRRIASGEYDDNYARYVDYVGRAHTSHGADPNILARAYETGHEAEGPSGRLKVDWERMRQYAVDW